MVDARAQTAFDRDDIVASYASFDDRSALYPAELHLFEAYVHPEHEVLDLGVGAGRTSGWLARRAAHYVGVDYAPNMVAAARDRLPDLDFEQGDAADLSRFADGSFDIVVFSFNGLDCLSSDAARQSCLRECHRVLRSQGVLILSRHNPRCFTDSRRPVIGRGRRAWVMSELRWLRASAEMALRHVRHRAFWNGAGYVHDGVHGGMLLSYATPARASGVTI